MSTNAGLKREGLEAEIAQLRELIRRLHICTRETDDLKELLCLMEGISRASQRLSALLKVQRGIDRQAEAGIDLGEQMLRVAREIAEARRNKS